jgi:peptide/nickel transport system substrate-binding protein
MRLRILLLVPLLIGLAACNQVGSGTLVPPTSSPALATPVPSSQPAQITTPIPTVKPDRLLTICLVNEPRSLFLYNAASSSEKIVLQAIYDGPFDIRGYIASPVILEKMPSLADGDALLQPVSANPGDLIVDSDGNLVNLSDGVRYHPSGCTSQACTQTFSGTGPVQMDQLVVRFTLRAGLQWSDGSPLTAADSVYSFEVAHSLYPSALPDLVSRTSMYKTLDDQTVEWTGVPGFIDSQYQTKFFSPLPQHAWANIPPDQLSSDQASAQKPIGWGAYVIDEWVPGDHITLHANPLYFRAGEGLPHFDNLVFRFVADNSEALTAVLAGECDLADQAAGLETQTASLFQLREQGKISLAVQSDTAWDLLEFDVAPLSPDHPAYFASPQVRQAVAMCIDRQAIVDNLSAGKLQVADLYIPPDHPLYNTDVTHYTFNPAAASKLLTAAGWLDTDNDPSTPRLAQGVAGIADDTPFEVQYLTADDSEHQAAAQLIQAGLTQCGIRAHIDAQPVQQYLASGPDGPVFGRNFDLAQFAWSTTLEPPCSLFITSEIPGPYPEYVKGWGGMDAGGYSNPAYDQACLDAIHSLSDMPQYLLQHAKAQAIFSEDLPAIPLYWHYRLAIGRPDLCGLHQSDASGSLFSGLETVDYGEGCP